MLDSKTVDARDYLLSSSSSTLLSNEFTVPVGTVSFCEQFTNRN